MDTPPQQSVKDFSDYYHESIAVSLEKIDLWSDYLYSRPALVININYEMEKIFRRIHNRLDDKAKKKQKLFMKHLDILKPAIPNKVKDPQGDGYRNVISKTTDYKKFRSLMKARLLHLWDCLDELGMTSKKKESDTVYS